MDFLLFQDFFKNYFLFLQFLLALPELEGLNRKIEKKICERSEADFRCMLRKLTFEKS